MDDENRYNGNLDKEGKTDTCNGQPWFSRNIWTEPTRGSQGYWAGSYDHRPARTSATVASSPHGEALESTCPKWLSSRGSLRVNDSQPPVSWRRVALEYKEPGRDKKSRSHSGSRYPLLASIVLRNWSWALVMRGLAFTYHWRITWLRHTLVQDIDSAMKELAFALHRV